MVPRCLRRLEPHAGAVPKTTVIAPPFDRSAYPSFHADRIEALVREARDHATVAALDGADPSHRLLVLAATMIDAAERRAITRENERPRPRKLSTPEFIVLVFWMVMVGVLILKDMWS